MHHLFLQQQAGNYGAGALSLGYRVKSSVATRFRQWATKRLREYLIQGFTMNDEFLKNNGGGVYWKKPLARIRDIRSSEKMLDEYCNFDDDY